MPYFNEKEGENGDGNDFMTNLIEECLLDHGKICNLPNTKLDELFLFLVPTLLTKLAIFVRYLYTILNTMWHITVAINCTKKPVHYTRLCSAR